MGNLPIKLGKKQQSGRNAPPLGVLLTGMHSSGVSTIKSKWSGQWLAGPWANKERLDQINVQTAQTGFEVKPATKTNKTNHRTGFLISSMESGGRSYRKVWRDHINNLDAIVFVVDSTHEWKVGQTSRLPTSSVQYARHELRRLLSEGDLLKLPLLVLCNKQDSTRAKSPEVIRDCLNLSKDRPWKVLGCSTTTGEGLEEGLDWLVSESAKLRAIPKPLRKKKTPEKHQVHDDDDTASDTVTESSAENSVSLSTTPTISKKSSSSSTREDLMALLGNGYDPTSKAAGSTLGRFQPIRQGSSCPFAKASKLWGGRADVAVDSISLEEQAKANVKALMEFTRRSEAGENLDGFCFELAEATAGKTPEDLGRAVRRFLTALSDMDPAGEAMMRVQYIGSRGWRFRFAKADFFVTTFAPCYPPTSSRYAFGTGRAFLLLQPELSFYRHGLPQDTPHTNWETPQTVRDKTRVAFRKAGREYYIPDTTQYPAAEHIVKPLAENKDGTGDVVRWWESDTIAGDSSTSPPVVQAVVVQ